MTSFLSETRRRKLFRVAVLYIVAAWVVLQVADLAFPGLDIPESAIRYVWMGAFFVFPLALLAGWFYNITPKGLVRTASVDNRDVSDHPLGRSDYLLLTALLLLSASIIYGLTIQIVRMRTVGPDDVKTDRFISASIAVLPFVNAGDNQQNDYLADGISEDILNRLARLSNLHVASRTSSFNLNGKGSDFGLVSKLLRVDHILAGTVARSGDVVRVSAQLVRGDSGEPIWSRVYKKEWTDFFGIQDDIASAVTGVLGIDEATPLARTHEPDREAYDLYLRARFIAQARTPETLARSVNMVRQALDMDPLFAEARGYLASLYFFQKAYTTGSEEEHARLFDLAEKTAVHALVLDVDLPSARALLGVRALYRHEWQLAEENFKRAIFIAPNDSQVRRWYSRQLMWLGYLEEALFQARAAQRIDPISAVSNGNLGLAFALLGENAEAKKYAGIARELGLDYFYNADIMVDLSDGRLADAARAWAAGLKASGHDADIITMVMNTSDQPESIASTIAHLEALAPEAGAALEWTLAVLFLRQYEKFLDNVEEDGFMELWIPLAQPARQLSSFRKVVTEAGMVDYWKIRGWPDLCQPADDDFICS